MTRVMTPEQYEAYQALQGRRMVVMKEPKITRRKFGNEPTDGHASKREGRRAEELRLMAKTGLISDLEEQVRYTLIPAQYIDGKCVERAVTYTLDFQYRDENGMQYEDTKGYANDRWAIKRKLMLQVHNIRVKEV